MRGTCDHVLTPSALPLESLFGSARHVVAVAPHPDDDVLGCGGVLAAAAARGLAVDVVYVTDGTASHVGSPSFPAKRLRALREAEAAAALAVIGVRSPPRFLRWPDGTVPQADDPAAAALLPSLAGAIPHTGTTLVLSPWARDPHPDHRAVSALVRAAVAARPNVILAEYRVWLDERGSPDDAPRAADGTLLVCDVSPYAARKRNALAMHRSQLGEVISDAREAFVLPPRLIAAAGATVERFVLVA